MSEIITQARNHGYMCNYGKYVHLNSETLQSLPPAPLDFHLGIINLTGSTLYVYTQNGVVYELRSNNVNQFSEKERGLTLLNVNFQDSKLVTAYMPINRNYPNRETIMKEHYIATIENRYSNSYHQYRHSSLRHIPYDVLDENETVYIEDLNLLVSFSYKPNEIFHPYSYEGIKKYNEKVNESVKSDYGRQSYFRIEIVDNSDRVSTQYYELNGSVYKCEPVQRKHLHEGVYVYGNTPVHRKDDFKPNKAFGGGEYYTFDEFEKYGIVKFQSSIAEALRVKEKEVEEAKREVELMKHQFTLNELKRKDSSSLFTILSKNIPLIISLTVNVITFIFGLGAKFGKT